MSRSNDESLEAKARKIDEFSYKSTYEYVSWAIL